MPTHTTPAIRLREARKRAGLSPDEAAARMRISAPSLWDLETYEDELFSVYGPSEVVRFCRALVVSPAEVLDFECQETPVSAAAFATRIQEHRRFRGIPLTELEDFVGWKAADFLDQPEQLLETLSTDGLQLLCRGVDVDWRRVVLSL
jgi:transcriptional regulator with XRE-family HTH domain